MQWYFTRTLYNNLCATLPGVTPIQHEITMLAKYSPRLYIVTFHLDAQRPLKGQSLRMPLSLKYHNRKTNFIITIIMVHCFQALGVLETFFPLHMERRE